MLIGFNLPISGPMASPAAMARVAKQGEDLGFDYLTLTDHIALPDVASPGYPYSESGEFYSPDPGVRHGSGSRCAGPDAPPSAAIGPAGLAA